MQRFESFAVLTPAETTVKSEPNAGVIAWFQCGCETHDDFAAIPQMPGRLVPGCTVAICTYKRVQSLNRFLNSLRQQSRPPDRLVIVDASPDEETEIALRARQDLSALAGELLYFRVNGPLKGLTRQRNFALKWVATEHVVFFDDDVDLDRQCIEEMDKALRADRVVGVGASMNNEQGQPRLRWRMMRLLRMVPRLTAGRYWRCGMGTPWALAEPTESVIEGDFLPGAGMMWKTDSARQVGFCEQFDGYAQAEDLDFSLRMRNQGKLVMAGRARLQHFCDPQGRPDEYEKGYMEIYNQFFIHRRTFPNRTRGDLAWFTYTWSLDTLFLMHNLFRPGKSWQSCKLVAGRLKAAWHILRRRQAQ